MNEIILEKALENVLGVLILVIAYKIYKSNCHTLIRSKIFTVEVSENTPTNTTTEEISLPQILSHNGSL